MLELAEHLDTKPGSPDLDRRIKNCDDYLIESQGVISQAAFELETGNEQVAKSDISGLLEMHREPKISTQYIAANRTCSGG